MAVKPELSDLIKRLETGEAKISVVGMGNLKVPKEEDNGEGDLATRLRELQERAERARTEKARAEATLESLEKQRNELVAEIREMGVEPEDLPAEIERLEEEIAQGLKKAEELLPPETP